MVEITCIEFSAAHTYSRKSFLSFGKLVPNWFRGLVSPTIPQWALRVGIRAEREGCEMGNTIVPYCCSGPLELYQNVCKFGRINPRKETCSSRSQPLSLSFSVHTLLTYVWNGNVEREREYAKTNLTNSGSGAPEACWGWVGNLGTFSFRRVEYMVLKWKYCLVWDNS